MGWLYVPGLEGSSSGSDWPWEGDTAVWATSSGTDSPRPRSWRGWRTRPWSQHLSGTISQPSTADRIAASWIGSLPDCPASPTASPARCEMRQTNEHSGPTSSASSASAPQQLSFWRMSPASSASSSPPGDSYESWASSSLRRCWQPPRTTAPPMSDGASTSSLPTPAARDWKSSHASLQTLARNARPLNEVLRALPTPTAQYARRSGAAGYSTSSERHSGTTLTDVVLGAASARRPGQMNPQLREWMMGLPIGWTAHEPLARGSFRSWWQKHSACLQRSGDGRT